MKKFQIPALLAFIVLFLSFTTCTKNHSANRDISLLDTITFNHSMKGWELYSWPEAVSWKYSLLKGTNRLKSLDEVISNKIKVTGTDSLKMLIGKMPEGEEIYWKSTDWLESIWRSNYGNLSLPDSLTINDMKEYCTSIGLKLFIVM